MGDEVLEPEVVKVAVKVKKTPEGEYLSASPYRDFQKGVVPYKEGGRYFLNIWECRAGFRQELLEGVFSEEDADRAAEDKIRELIRESVS